MATRPAFRNGIATYCGFANPVVPGMWSGGIVGVKSILGIKSRRKAYKILNDLQELGYLTYTLDRQTKQLTYRITDWVTKCSGAACEEGAVYASTGYGFIGMPRYITQRLVDKGYKFEPGDAFLDLWCHTVYRDYGNAFSFLAPDIQYEKYGSVLTLETLGKRWGGRRQRCAGSSKKQGIFPAVPSTRFLRLRDLQSALSHAGYSRYAGAEPSCHYYCITCRMLTVSGKGKRKTIRLHKSALPLLQCWDEDAYENYMAEFDEHTFSGNARHVERNHLVAETAVMCMKAGIEANPLYTPEVMDDEVRRHRLTEPCFYFARELNRVNDYELNKIRFTSLAGAIVYPGGAYAVYNYREEMLRWMGEGELKIKLHLQEIFYPMKGFEFPLREVAIIFGADYGVALNMLKEMKETQKMDNGLFHTYKNIFFMTDHYWTKPLDMDLGWKGSISSPMTSGTRSVRCSSTSRQALWNCWKTPFRPVLRFRENCGKSGLSWTASATL